MHLTELRTFLTIIETGSLVRAAEVLNVTQSTVTARLKSLELDVGQTLIIRKKSGATATPAGLRLHRYASTISDLWSQAKQDSALSDKVSAICTIAVQTDLWTGLGDRMFDHMYADCPDIGLTLWQGSQKEISEWVKAGLVDVALTYSTSVNPAYASVRLNDEELILVATDADQAIRFNPEYVFVEAGEEFGQQHAAAYADASISRINFGSAQLGLTHILDVGGSAYLPRRLVADHLTTGALVQLPDGPTFSRSIHLLSKKSTSASWDWVNSKAAIDALLIS